MPPKKAPAKDQKPPTSVRRANSRLVKPHPLLQLSQAILSNSSSTSKPDTKAPNNTSSSFSGSILPTQTLSSQI